jgi:glutathione S-transferase
MGIVDDAGSFVATLVRLGRGIYPRGTAEKRIDPKQTLELYDYEGCPFCRKVREALTELDLDYIARPVAHGSPRRKLLKSLGGKVQVPYLVDPNTGTRMYESNDIVAYLDATYGGEGGWRLPLPGFLNDINSGLASAVRLARGTRSRVGHERKKKVRPLTLYNMEGSPYCRKVREVLTELDLEHLVRNVPKGSPKRADLQKRGGKIQVPYLIDPNTTEEMYESDDIVAYLEAEYGD